MEGGDRSDALDLVDVAAGLDQPFSEQRDAGTVAEKEQALGLRDSDVMPRDLGAGLALLLAHPRARRMNAGERGAVGLILLEADRGEHFSGEDPRLAADRLAGGGVLQGGSVAQQHD